MMKKDASYDILDLMARYGNDTERALREETCPECLYAFSPLRENLFEWTEIQKSSRVLQIGSDYGSYTGLLAERAGEVIVLDPRDENLEVNRLRRKGSGNVRFLRGDLLEPETGFREYKPAEDAKSPDFPGQGFDFIFLAGTLEQYKKEEAGALLKAAAGLLNQGGTLYFAAENTAGVRYWMGAEKFDVSFLRAEVLELLEDLKGEYGGESLLYYPVPDYRYPSAVYSDAHLPGAGEVTNISARLDGPGLQFGSEEKAMAMACKNGVFSSFSNSFLGSFRRGKS